MHQFTRYLFINLILLSISLSLSSEVLRPRGVAISKAPLYKVGENFTCTDGSLTVPFSYVNDDYCDCPDGTDEPGTSACTQGYFHCTNAGHKPKYIRSSLVNDGICDCCDTSDEYYSSASCINNCKELGKLAREQEIALVELRRAGYEKKLLLITEGKQKKDEMKARATELEKEKEAALKVKTEKEAIKNEIESKENEALEKYKSAEEELKKKTQEEDMARYMAAEKEQATSAFHFLDKDGDGKLHVSELMTDSRFDQNKDGVVTEEEAKFFLHMKDYLELEEYTTTGWMIMKPIISGAPLNENEEAITEPTEQPTTETQDVTEPEDVVEDPQVHSSTDDLEEQINEAEEEEEEEPEYDDYTDDYDGEEENRDPIGEVEEVDIAKHKRLRKMKKRFDAKHLKKEEPEKEENVYDEATQKIVDEAKIARDEFNAAESKVRDLENEINVLQSHISRDHGPEEQFFALQDNCYEYHHPEYVYKLCVFSRASQTSKSGGSDTSLGTWGRWSGPEHDKYSKMVYEGGQSCWNGPARSTEVFLSCGTENKIKSVSEPSKCLYMFEFETPAVCNKPSQDYSHDEL